MSSCNFVVFLLNRIAELMHIVDKQSSKVPVKQASKKSDVYSLVCFLNTAQSVWCEFRIVKYLVYECNCNLHSCVHVVHVWCVLAGPSGFVPRPWLSTCVVCARRAEWFCPLSMVVNLCGVCSQGRVVLSLVHGRQPVWCVLAGPSGFVPRPWSSTHRKRSWNSPKFATRPAWLPPMVGLLLLIFVVYVFSSAVHLRIENKTSMHNRHQFGVCLYCGRFRHFLV